MTPERGGLYTVTPHRMYDGSKTGFQCGRWHCRTKGSVFGDDLITVQQMKIVGGQWKPAMSTAVPVAALVPLEVDVDLFGNPIGDQS